MSTLLELGKAVDEADDERRAVARVPEVLREPGAADEAWNRWVAAREALTAARHAELEAGA